MVWYNLQICRQNHLAFEKVHFCKILIISIATAQIVAVIALIVYTSNHNLFHEEPTFFNVNKRIYGQFESTPGASCEMQILHAESSS